MMRMDRVHWKCLLKTSWCLAFCCMIAAPALARGAYLGPTVVVASPDGKRLFVAGTDANRLVIVEPGGKIVRSINMPSAPTGVAVSADATTAYVTCAAPKSTVCVVEVQSGKITASIPVGHTAIGPALSPDGRTLYVCNRFDNDVSVIDLTAKEVVKRIPAIREPYAAVVTPDGKSVFVINHLPLLPASQFDVAASVTVIDTASNATSAIRLPNGSTSVRGICISPDGASIYATHTLARHQFPTTHMDRGWMNTNAISVIDAKNKQWINTVLLDDTELGAANPWGVACSSDGDFVCVAHAGSHEVSAIDAKALRTQLAAMPSRKKVEAATSSNDRGAYTPGMTAEDVRNDLAFLIGMRRRIRLDDTEATETPSMSRGNGPRGLAIIGDKAYAACYFSDTLVEIRLNSESRQLTRVIPLGPRPELTTERRGEMLFNNADICFQRWQSCASCHPDARVDTLNWDLLNDGMGNHKNVKSMLLAHETPPAMASAIRANAEAGVRAGLEHILLTVRPEEDAVAIDRYLQSLTPTASPHLVDGRLSPAAERGKRLFVDKSVGCATCHPAPLYTDLAMHDVDSKGPRDVRATFDTPSLVECWRTAPYMHDGKYTTMKELLIQGKHGVQAGGADKLSAEQVEDLIEFVLSL